MHAGRLIIIAAVALSTQIAACRESKTAYFGTTKPLHPPDEIWINNSSEAEWLDPGKISGSIGGEVARNMFCGLVRAHPATLGPIPGVAHRFDVSPDGRTYTFHLRPSVWSDGTPVTAHTFEWSWKRLVDPATASKYSSILYVVQDAAAFNQRAILVTGTSSAALEKIKTIASKAGPIEKVEAAKGIDGLFVYVGGDSDAKPQLRQAVLTLLDGKSPFGDALSAKVADSSVVGVEAKDDLTFEVRLNDPIPFFLSMLPFYTFLPVPKHVIERLKSEGKNPDLWTRPEHIVVNGAYKLTEWKFRQYMKLEKNPTYWDVANVRMSKVRLAMVESYNTALNVYRAGEFDWVGSNTNLPAEFMDHLVGYKDFHRDPKLTLYWFWLNTKKKPLDDRRVRQALNLAIDRKAIVEHVTRAGQIPTADIVPDGLSGYVGLNSPIFDPERARKLLADAGYANGEGFPDLSLTYNTSESHKQIAEAIQQMWKKHLGVSIAIENQEWKVYLKNLTSMSFDIGRLGWIGDYPDPYTFLEVFTQHNGNNHSGWSDPEFERLLDESNRIIDPKARLQKMREAEAVLAEQVPVISLYVYTRSYMKKPWLLGFWPNHFDNHSWQYFHFDERWYDGVPDTPAPNPLPELPSFE